MAEDTTASANELVLAWQESDEPGGVEFIVTTAYLEEFLALLDLPDVTATPNPRALRSANAETVTAVATTVGHSAAWTVVGIAVKKFFDRNKDKRIKFGEDDTVEAEGFSDAAIARMLRAKADREPGDADGSDGRKP